MNYRGSNGRGSAYQKAIFADWGNKEVVDLLGAMDHVEKIGLADPDRLGIGGWSYGGILTNYTIATDGRFKAAISGAGSSNQISMYGTDMYIQQYEQELGPPWKNQDPVDQAVVSVLPRRPDQDADAVHGRREGLQRAARSAASRCIRRCAASAWTRELVIYPGQFHGITTPSYKKDRLERYLDWYDKYLKTPVTTTTEGRSRLSPSFRRCWRRSRPAQIASGRSAGPRRRAPAHWGCPAVVSVGRSPSTAPMCSSLSATDRD